MGAPFRKLGMKLEKDVEVGRSNPLKRLKIKDAPSSDSPLKKIKLKTDGNTFLHSFIMTENNSHDFSQYRNDQLWMVYHSVVFIVKKRTIFLINSLRLRNSSLIGSRNIASNPSSSM